MRLHIGRLPPRVDPTRDPSPDSTLAAEVYLRTHPRVNAALNARDPARIRNLGQLLRLDHILRARRDEVIALETQTFLPRNGISRQRVEDRDYSAAVLPDRRERMRFAAYVVAEYIDTKAALDHVRIESPVPRHAA